MIDEYQLFRTALADRAQARRDAILSAKATYRAIILRRFGQACDSQLMQGALDTLASESVMTRIPGHDRMAALREVTEPVKPLDANSVAADLSVLDRIAVIEKEIAKHMPLAKEQWAKVEAAKKAYDASPTSLERIDERSRAQTRYNEAYAEYQRNDGPATRIERLKQDIAAVKMEAGSRRLFDAKWLTEIHTR